MCTAGPEELLPGHDPELHVGHGDVHYDGKKIIWGNTASGHAGCGSNSATVAHSCNPRGNTNVERRPGLRRSVDLRTSARPVLARLRFARRYNRAAFWMNNANDASWPISQSRSRLRGPEREPVRALSSQGCSASLGNVVPVNGKYVLPLSWQIGGTNAVDWTNSLNPIELGWFDVEHVVRRGHRERQPAQPARLVTRRSSRTRSLRTGTTATSTFEPGTGVRKLVPGREPWTRGVQLHRRLGGRCLRPAAPEPADPGEHASTCAITISGSPKVKKKRTIKATVKVMGQRVKGAVVKAQTKGSAAPRRRLPTVVAPSPSSRRRRAKS